MGDNNLPESMEALVWMGPHHMELLTEPVPVPTPGEVLVEINAVGICGSELSGYLGQNSLRKPPLIMGHEAAGCIVAGSGDMLLADGSGASSRTRVTFNPLIVCGNCDRCKAGYNNLCRRRQLIGAHRPGAFARFVTVPAAQCWPLFPEMSDVTGSLAEPLACAVHAVSLTQVENRSGTLLVLGMGPIGLFCLAVARAQGIKVVLVSDMAPQRLEVARHWGAYEAINASENDVVATVQKLISGGVDAVIDAVGATVTRAQALNAVVPGGRVVFIGLHADDSSLEMNYLVRQEVTITGCFAYTHADFARAHSFLAQGLLRPSADWLQERPLAAGHAAFAELVNGTATATKIVLQRQ